MALSVTAGAVLPSAAAMPENAPLPQMAAAADTRPAPTDASAATVVALAAALQATPADVDPAPTVRPVPSIPPATLAPTVPPAVTPAPTASPPTPVPTPAPSASPAPTAAPSASPRADGKKGDRGKKKRDGRRGNGKREKRRIDRVIRIAQRQIGDRYILGANGPRAFDCSGLILYAFREARELDWIGGMPRTANGFEEWARRRDRFHRSRPVRGDLVIWNGGAHIGIYIGRGRAISALIRGVRKHRVARFDGVLTGYVRVRHR